MSTYATDTNKNTAVAMAIIHSPNSTLSERYAAKNLSLKLIYTSGSVASIQ